MSDYNVLSELGRGGLGVVELVEKDGKQFARKRFLFDSTTDSKDLQRFKREIEIQQSLSNDGPVMPILNYDLNDESNYWYIMPLASEVYSQKISQDKNDDKIDNKALTDILDALDFIHKRGYVHRDLKPENILLHDGIWKLADFGAVLPPQGQMTTITSVLGPGTKEYAAPELATDYHNVRSSADIFSFGCILHDIFGINPRTPFSTVTDAHNGKMSMILEKCTDQEEDDRIKIKDLRPLLQEFLLSENANYDVKDQAAHEWLDDLANIKKWDTDKFNDFALFFYRLDTYEVTESHDTWTTLTSTPFLTRIPVEAMEIIIKRKNRRSLAIIRKYCKWAKRVSFQFDFADLICERLKLIYDLGDTNEKAITFCTMVILAYDHNRWYIMQCIANRASSESLKDDVAWRLAMDLSALDLNYKFIICLRRINFNIDLIHPELRKVIEEFEEQ